MEETYERDTFVAMHDLLQAAAQRCLEAEANLKVLTGQGSDPAYFAWAEIADQEHRLAKLLLDFSRKGSANLLDTRFQYSPEETRLPRPATPGEAVAALVNVNYRLSEDLRELSLNIAPPELGELLEDLRRQVESMGQTISMISVTMLDN